LPPSLPVSVPLWSLAGKYSYYYYGRSTSMRFGERRLGPVDQLNSQNLAPEISPPIAAGPPPVGITCCTRVGDRGPGITHQKRSRRARWAGPGQQLLLRLVDSAGDMTLPAGEGGGSTREQEPSTSSSLRLLSDSNCTMPCPHSLCLGISVTLFHSHV